MPIPITSATLARYFDDTATPEERALVEAWIGDDPARRAAIDQWRAAWQADIEQLGAAYDAETAWARLSERVGLLTLVRGERGERPAREVRLTPFARPRSRRATAVRWAAAAAVVLAAGVGAWRARSHWGLGAAPTQVAMREYRTSRGQRSILRLPDGSEVMLNVASRLRVPATFGAAGQPRALELDGQAYFTVTHDATRPFTVRTARGITRDVGTRFDVRAYADEAAERVAVAEGEVAVRGDSAGVEVPLRKGQVAMITASGYATLAQGADADLDQALAWTGGWLQLDDVTLAEAARLLGRWYDLDVYVQGDELARRRVVGSYRDESVTQVLDIIAAAVGARYERQGQTVTFFPHGR